MRIVLCRGKIKCLIQMYKLKKYIKGVPFFQTNWDDYDKCPVCNSVLKNGKKMAKIYSNGELIEEDVLLPLKICQTYDIG